MSDYPDTPIQNPVGWFEIYVNDMERAVKFYEAVFQIQLSRLDAPKEGLMMYAFPMTMDGYGAAGALAKMEGVSAGPGSVLIYFSCDDCADQAARAAENGGSVIHEKFAIGEHGFIAMVNDSEGNIIGLHSIK